MRTQHDNKCLWWKDWHSCSCGYLEEEVRLQMKTLSEYINNQMEQMVQTEVCAEIIPGTFIMCGEGVGNEKQYCSDFCYKKSKGK